MKTVADFIKQNIPDWETDNEVARYIGLRDGLSEGKPWGTAAFADYLDVKNKLFAKAMTNFLKSRGAE